MEDFSNPSTPDSVPPAPDDASAPDEQPMPNPSTPDGAPPSTDNAAAASAPPNPPSPAAPPRWRRVGAGIGALGALLALCGALLPTYGSGDYEGAALKHAPLILVGLLIAPALVILGISIWVWFNKPSLWLVALGCLLIIVALPVHWFVEALFASFACFDVCPPGGVHYGTGFWLPLVGFPLGGIGMVFAAIASALQVPKRAAPAT